MYLLHKREVRLTYPKSTFNNKDVLNCIIKKLFYRNQPKIDELDYAHLTPRNWEKERLTTFDRSQNSIPIKIPLNV